MCSNKPCENCKEGDQASTCFSGKERIRPILNGGPFNYSFFCPGCGRRHGFNSNPAHNPCWELSGTMERPTIQPSILVRWYDWKKEVDVVCHSFVTDGQIQYLSDCTHELAGQTVELPVLPA